MEHPSVVVVPLESDLTGLTDLLPAALAEQRSLSPASAPDGLEALDAQE